MTYSPALAVPYHQHLLPPNSTILERAIAAQDHKILDVPVPLRDLIRWDTCPAHLLSWLAWAMGVDVWSDSWSETQKRGAIRDSFALHRIKGTLEAQRRYIALAGSTLYRATRPPAKNFLGRSLSVVEKEAFIERLPQIRIFPTRRTANAGFRAFWRGKHGRFFQDADGNPDCFAREVDRNTKMTTRAVYVFQGITRELYWAPLSDNGEQVMFPGKRRNGAFALGTDGNSAPILNSNKCFWGHATLRKSDATGRILRMNLARTSAIDQLINRFALVPRGETVNIVPWRVYEKGFAPRSVFCGVPISPTTPEPASPAGWGRRFFYPSGAKYRVFDTVYFKDPSVSVGATGAHNFMGQQRFGMPAYTAELKVIVPGKRTKFVADRFVRGHFYAAPKENLRNALVASRAAKSARDEIRVDTKVFRPLTIGTPLFVGAPLKIGQFTLA